MELKMTESGIKDIFISEAREILQNLESDIVHLEENADDSETINRIFRHFHTMKGSSGIAGLNDIYEFSHKLENLLDLVRSEEIKVNIQLIDLILASIDWIREQIFTEDGAGPESKITEKSLVKRINAFLGEAVDEELEGKEGRDQGMMSTGYNYYRVKARFSQGIFEKGIDPLMIMEDLLSMGTVLSKNVSRKALPDFNSMDPEKCYLAWDLILKTLEPVSGIEDVFIFVKDENEISVEDVTARFNARGVEALQEKRLGEIMLERGLINEKELSEAIKEQEAKKSKLGDIFVKKGYATEKEIHDALNEQEKLKKKIELSTVRVDTAKLDNLLNLLGEIVIGQSSLAGIADEIEDDKESGFQLKNALYGLDRTTREFQEQLMSIRMIPVGPTFEQFKRFVRDSARSNKKEIKLAIEGGDTELDKTVIEKISDPLKHMIRNAIDHGIEDASERTAGSKPATGLVTLRAYHQEGNVYIEVIDDGRGIDHDRIRKKAISLGYIKDEDDVSRDRLMMFLFQPGFSTAEQVGDLSGRGVGMDVVKTNIEELRGMVEIKSELGKGTTVRIKLPLTLAIVEGMLVSVGANIFIIPLLSIIESMQPTREDIKTIEGRGEVFHFRGEYLPLVRLYDSFGIEANRKDPWDGLVVVVESSECRTGILVDDLMGQQQIVIKSLDSYITQSRAISGAAILGDGKVALILDIHGLVEDITTLK
jgi:two-component system chemotaxis sensor kinase CheA